ncbi:MAG TPA: ubiquinol-cytochrome C chaperone family protein [Micropepsaceae bacterium]|jgi:cytochrome b pre-mRNA-processing protein 3
MLRRFLGSDKSAAAARVLYAGLVVRARAPVFHTAFQVPDTIDGRFDLLALHGFVVMEALKPLRRPGRSLGTALASVIFAGFDDALRELGVSDFGIPRRIKAMAGAFYGRLEAYGAADSQRALGEAILRNLYRAEATRRHEADVLAHYIALAREALRAQADVLLQGHADFGPLPKI